MGLKVVLPFTIAVIEFLIKSDQNGIESWKPQPPPAEVVVG